MADDLALRSGSCHCGSVRFEVRLSDGFNTVRRCTCSYCRMRGAVAVSAPIGGIRIIEGEDVLSSYRFNTGVAQHSSVHGAVSTRITNAARIRPSTASTLPAWRASVPSISLKYRCWMGWRIQPIPACRHAWQAR
jgi:hypothetical protein